MRTVLTCLIIVCVAMQAQAAGQKTDVKNSKKAAVKPAPKLKTPAAKPATVKAAKKTPKPATTAVAMKVTVVSVEGIAHRKCVSDPKPKWQPVKAGETLDELTFIRTGLGSKVVLRFADRGEVTVKNGTKIGIAEFRKKGNLAKTRLGLKYGSIRAKVDSSKSPNDFRVATPVATLSVRGSDGHLGYGALGLGFFSTQSKWYVKTPGGSIYVWKGEGTDGGL
ncbi:MAG: FecR domain-containing protein, partial [Phycisphaerae bacterium]|nr:FecR domain-containing protein [Phycisphaerae bacterium]